MNMARKDKPYLPLYIQDFMTDEKLMECSAEATGVYIRLMCLLHKSETYGKILLKQKYKQKGSKEENFACQIAKSLPYDLQTISRAVNELIAEGVVTIEGDFLLQKRMVRDAELSSKRATAGASGGKNTQSKNKDFAKAKNKANKEANADIEIDIDNDIDLEEKGGPGEKEETPQTKNSEAFYIVPEMLGIFKTHKPSYVVQADKDYPALRKIAEVIAGQEHVELFSPEGFAAVKAAWQVLAAYIQTHRLYKDFALMQIEKYIQGIISACAASAPGSFQTDQLKQPSHDYKSSVIQNNYDAAAKAREILNRKHANQNSE